MKYNVPIILYHILLRTH